MSKSRQSGNLPLKQRILIICEGETECNYFKEIRNDLQLTVRDLVIEYGNSKHCYGNDPSQILKYAIDHRYRYDNIFCTFDKDNHKKYKSTLEEIHSINKQHKEDVEIKAINSVPCFEYWLLLHFYKYPHPSTRPMTQDEAGKEIKKYIPNYKKAMKGLLDITKTYLKNATKNAELVIKNNRESDNPSTKIHELINYLQTLVK